MQVHYNMLVQRDVLDRTTVDLYYADKPVAKPAHILPLANDTFVIPPGTTQTVTAEVPVFGSWEMWGVVPHMHLHGTEIKVSVVHADGSSTCAVDIPRWDFHWQQFYYYVDPLRGRARRHRPAGVHVRQRGGKPVADLGRVHHRRDVPDVPLFHFALIRSDIP